MSGRGPLYSTDLYTAVTIDGDVATVHFSSYANDRMEEMIALEFLDPGRSVRQSHPLGSVDVMKALIDIPAAVSGVIVAVNPKVIDTPDLSKEDPFGEGWLVKLRVSDPPELDGLLSEEAYQERARDS